MEQPGDTLLPTIDLVFVVRWRVINNDGFSLWAFNLYSEIHSLIVMEMY